MNIKNVTWKESIKKLKQQFSTSIEVIKVLGNNYFACWANIEKLHISTFSPDFTINGNEWIAKRNW